MGRRVMMGVLAMLLPLVFALTGCGGPGRQGTQQQGNAGEKSAQEGPATPAPREGQSTEPVSLTIVGYLQGTTMQLRAEAIGEALRKFAGYDVTVKTGQGLGTVIDAQQGKVDLFLNLSSYNITKEMLEKETPEVAAKYRESLIIPTGEKAEHFLVLDEVPISSWPDLIAKKYPVKIGVGGSTAVLLSDKVFKSYGIEFADVEKWGGKVVTTMGGPQVAEQMKDGILQAHFLVGELGSPYYEDLAAARKVKLLPVAETKEELDKITSVLPDMYRRVIPGGTYSFASQDIPSVAYTEFLIARPDLPEDVVYNITKVIWENTAYLGNIFKGFNRLLVPQPAMQMLAPRASDINPGAARYYREKGWLK